MTTDQATATVTRTWTGTVRLRNARERHAQSAARHRADGPHKAIVLYVAAPTPA